jgi:hypothetical protein
MFGLGWLMAELFDPRRQESVTERQSPFNPEVQLPLVAELDPADRLNFLVVDLGDLLTPYEQLSNEAVRAEADKRKPGSAEPFDSGRFNAAVTSLHQTILDQLANQQEQLSSYQLGLALSDMCWLPSAAGGPDAFIGMFKIAAAALGGLLYLIIANLSGASQFWASLVAIATFLGCSGAGLGTGVSRAFGGIGSELWSTARLDAQAWNATWLPALPQSAAQRVLLDNRGVAAPQIRKNLEA